MECSEGVARDTIQMRFDPRPTGEYVVSSSLGASPLVYFNLLLRDVYSI